MKKLTVIFSLLLATSLSATPAENIGITVYSSADPASFSPQQFAQQQKNQHLSHPSRVPGFAVVKEERPVELQKGVNQLRFTDVAQFIDPTTVSFKDLSSKGQIQVLEQNFEFDLASPEKVLERYIDREVQVETVLGDQRQSVQGTLLSSLQNQLLLRTPNGVQLIPSHNAHLKLGDLPGGLITKPTLVWNVQSNTAGQRRVRTTYQTEGVTWRADYNVLLNEADTLADLGAWVTLVNLSGASYPNAQLKLIAGDVQRVTPKEMPMALGARSLVMEDSVAGAGFEQKSFFEYHLYTLPRRTDVAANTTQQIALFPDKTGVKVEKVLVYYGLPFDQSWGFVGSPISDRNWGNQSNKKVDVYVQFKNEEQNNLGIPLPKGKVRLYKQDGADGSTEFLGEDIIDHTPKNELVRVKVGQAFDVIGERTQQNFQIDTRGREITETIEIVLKNQKATAQKVLIRETLFRWLNWQIEQKTDEFERVDNRTIHFPVTVPAEGEKRVSYTVRYSW